MSAVPTEEKTQVLEVVTENKWVRLVVEIAE
jgi:hypothetical protein